MNVRTIWADMRQASGQGDTPEAQQVFLRAVNSVINDLNGAHVYSGTSTTALPQVTSVDTGTIACAKFVENALYPGIQYYMQEYRQWVHEPSPEALGIYTAHLNRAKAATLADSSVTRRTRHEPDTAD